MEKKKNSPEKHEMQPNSKAQQFKDEYPESQKRKKETRKNNILLHFFMIL